MTVPSMDVELRDALVNIGRGRFPEYEDDEIVRRVLVDIADRARRDWPEAPYCFAVLHRDEGLGILEGCQFEDMPAEVVAFAIVPLGPVDLEALEDEAAEFLVWQIEAPEREAAEKAKGPPPPGKSRWW